MNKEGIQSIKILAIIPARSGSKRVKNKNIRILRGKPLIAHTIEQTKKSKYIEKIVVSTDGIEIAKIAQKWGASVIMRPKAISDDNSTEYEYYDHVLRTLKEKENYEPDLIVNLYPTSPFRKAETIDKAIKRLLAHPEADCLRSVRKCSEHPYKMWKMVGEFLEPFVPSKNNNLHTFSTQLFPEVYIQNANIYIIRSEAFYKNNATIGNNILSFVMSNEESMDINTESDFLMAEILLSEKKK